MVMGGTGNPGVPGWPVRPKKWMRAALMKRTIPLLLISLVLCGCAAKSGGMLTKVTDVPLPGGSTRFDYQSLDPTTGRLYLSHMDDGTLVVFDTRSDKVIANIAGFPRVTGVR